MDSVCYCFDMTIHEIIHELTDRFGLSQAEIYRRTGIPQPTINRLVKRRQVQVIYSHGKALERLLEEMRQPDDAREAA